MLFASRMPDIWLLLHSSAVSNHVLKARFVYVASVMVATYARLD
jgi:hypothetical protein